MAPPATCGRTAYCAKRCVRCPVVGGDFRRRLRVRRGLSISVSGFRQLRRQASPGLRRANTSATPPPTTRCSRRAWRPGARSASSSSRRIRARSASAIASISTTAPPATAPPAHGNHAVGAPDLTDADWLYGGDGDTILTSILDGRNGVMPPQGPALGHNGTNAVASYVVSRSGTIAPPDQVAAGKVTFRHAMRRLSRRGWTRQSGAGRAQSVRQRLALRRRHRKRRGQRARWAQRRHAGLAHATHLPMRRG